MSDPREEQPEAMSESAGESGSGQPPIESGVLFGTPPPPPIPDSLRQDLARPGAQSSIKPKKRGTDASSLAAGLAMGSDLLFTIGGGLLLGWAADHWLGWTPWGLLLGLALGMTAALYRVIRRTQSTMR